MFVLSPYISRDNSYTDFPRCSTVYSLTDDTVVQRPVILEWLVIGGLRQMLSSCGCTEVLTTQYTCRAA
jgi:hypothetical protein